MPQTSGREVLCHGSLLQGKYFCLQLHLDSSKGMLMEDVDDGLYPKPELQGKTSVAQLKVELQRKNVAP